jgi:photosystem II stability/assembly factor-like uncharacterized protein
MQIKNIVAGFVALGSALSFSANAQINSSTFGTMEARWLGPGTMSGRITAIQGVNSEPKTIYVGTAGGGIWKTTNSGASFKPIFDKYTQSIGDLAIDQTNPRTIFVGTGESNMRNSVSYGDGMYKSTDGGENWQKIGLDSTEHIAKIAIHPKNGNVVFVAAPGPLFKDSPHRGLYKSEDGGKTWVKSLYISEKAGAADVSIDPSNPEIIYATTWEFRRMPYSFNSGGPGGGIWKSTDGGKNWKRIQNGLPPGLIGRVALTLAPSAPKNLVAIAELDSNKTGLYISENGGDSWKSQSASLNVVSRPFYFSTIVIDPKEPKRVYRPAYGFSYSEDGGYSFASGGGEGGAPHADHHALWINPNNTNELWLGTDGGVYISLDKGANWSYKHNIPVGQFYHVATDRAEPYRIYGGLQDNGSWVAPSASPGGVNNSVWQDIFGGDGFWVVPDPSDQDICYAEAQGGTMGRVTISTGKSVSIQPQQAAGEEKLRWNWNTPLHVGPSSKTLYTGAQYLYRSTDQGRNWTRISPDLTTNDKKKQQQEGSGGLSADVTSAENHCTIFSIAESPLDGNLIWAGTDDGNLQLTTDGGKSWTNVSPNIANAGIPSQTWVSSIQPGQHNKQVVYATFDNHMYGDNNSYVAKSEDLGKTWILLKGGEVLEGYAHKVKEDAVNKELLFLGTERGLYCSLNGGKEWFRMKNNVPWYGLVRDIDIHPVTHDLVLGTHGRGIIVVDDIRPIRAMTAQTASQPVVLFAPGTFKMSGGQFGGSGFPIQGGWNGGNPPAIPAIEYYLKDRVMSGDVKVDILDADGNLVQSVPGTKRKGINRLYWNQRMKPPRTAEGGVKIDFSSFLAPMVLPGNYTVKLIVSGKEFSQPLTLVHDDKSGMTLVERKAQYEASMKIYAMQEELAVLVDTINKTQTALKSALEKTTQKKTKQSLQAYFDQSENLRGQLLATKNKSIFADEKRYKEELGELYSAVAGNEQAPSNLQLQRLELSAKQLADFKAEWVKMQAKYKQVLLAKL